MKPVFAWSKTRELRAVVAGTLFPQTQDLFGDFVQSQRSTETATFRRSSSQIESGNVGLRQFSNWRLGRGLAWELDFWGRFRRAIEAADARLNSSIENYDDVLVLLIAEVPRPTSTTALWTNAWPMPAAMRRCSGKVLASRKLA